MSQEEKRTYAKSQIKDESMRVEIFFVSAVVFSREVGRGETPKVRVDGLLVGSNVRWGEEIFSLPEPNFDTILLAACKSVESTME